jgi:hypothetical protein
MDHVLEHFWCEMMNAEKWLIDALTREQKCSDIYSRRRTAESLEEWRAARMVVDQLAGEYFNSIHRCREEAAAKEPSQPTRYARRQRPEDILSVRNALGIPEYGAKAMA